MAILHPTHTRKKDKENKHSRMQERSSKVEKFACQECKQKEKSSHTGKLESKKQNKKVISRQEGLGGKFPSNCRKKPRPTNYLCEIF